MGGCPYSPSDHHLSWLVAAAVQIMAKQAFQLAPDSWHEWSWTQTPHTPTRTRTPTPGTGKGSWQPIRQVSAPLETDLLWATYGPCLASFMANSLDRERRRRRRRRHVWCWQKFSHFARMLSLVTKIVELAKAPLGQSENSNNCREREIGSVHAACDISH